MLKKLLLFGVNVLTHPELISRRMSLNLIRQKSASLHHQVTLASGQPDSIDPASCFSDF